MVVRHYFHRRAIVRNHRIFYTKNGYFGLGIPESAAGGIVAVLSIWKVPMILQKIDSYFVPIGSCYIPGIMDGEAVGASEEIKEFDIG
jgi:hypothetical protein